MEANMTTTTDQVLHAEIARLRHCLMLIAQAERLFPSPASQIAYAIELARTALEMKEIREAADRWDDPPVGHSGGPPCLT